MGKFWGEIVEEMGRGVDEEQTKERRRTEPDQPKSA